MTRTRKPPIKHKPKEKTSKLSLTCRQWATIRNQLRAVLTADSLANLRVHNDSNLPERVSQAFEIIKANILDDESQDVITIEAPVMAWSRVPWVLEKAVGHKLKGINGSVYGDICRQLQNH